MCDNINSCHDNKLINETKDGVRFICKECKEISVFRIGLDGRMDNRAYAKVFKRDSVQPGSNLYYKYNEGKMSIV